MSVARAGHSKAGQLKPTVDADGPTGQIADLGGNSRMRPHRRACPLKHNTPGTIGAGGIISRHGAAGLMPRVNDRYFGNSTVSITWMTPLDAMISAAVTVAFSTLTPLRPSM